MWAAQNPSRNVPTSDLFEVPHKLPSNIAIPFWADRSHYKFFYFPVISSSPSCPYFHHYVLMGLTTQVFTTVSQSLVFSFLKHCLISTVLYLFNTILIRHIPQHIMNRILHPFGGSRGAYSVLSEKDVENGDIKSPHRYDSDESNEYARRSSESYESSEDLLPAFRDTPRSSRMPWFILALVLIVDALFLSWLILAITRHST